MEVSLSQVSHWNSSLVALPFFVALQNVVSNNDVNGIAANRDSLRKINFDFRHLVDPQGKITNQKSSGRCWLFAGLNVLRNKMIKEYKLESDFELSQSYLFFYDKLERANFFLETIIANRTKDLEDRVIQHVFDDPLCDGGQWDMFTNLVKKYGVVPKNVYGETYHSSRSSRMNWVLTWKLRQYAEYIFENGNESDENLRQKKNEFLGEFYRLLSLFLGTPPTNFNWYYTDTDKKYHQEMNLTPRDFMRMTNVNVDDYVCLVDDPRNEYNTKLRVKYLGNVAEGNAVTYFNVPINVLSSSTAASIRGNDPVWFGCDVGKWLHRDTDYMDTNLFSYDKLFDTNLTMSKKNKLIYRNSIMTHAMVFTGYDSNERNNNVSQCMEEDITKWRVENSWDAKGIQKGYYTMSQDWFREYVYEVVIHKSYLDKNLLEVMNGEVPVKDLPPWDPMGSLA